MFQKEGTAVQGPWAGKEHGIFSDLKTVQNSSWKRTQSQHLVWAKSTQLSWGIQYFCQDSSLFKLYFVSECFQLQVAEILVPTGLQIKDIYYFIQREDYKESRLQDWWSQRLNDVHRGPASESLSAIHSFNFFQRQVPLKAVWSGTCFPVLFEQKRHFLLFSKSLSKLSLASISLLQISDGSQARR